MPPARSWLSSENKTHMNIKSKNGVISVLSAVLLTAGTVVASVATFEVHSAATQQSQLLLPSAQIKWAAASVNVTKVKAAAVGEFLGTIEIP